MVAAFKQAFESNRTQSLIAIAVGAVALLGLGAVAMRGRKESTPTG